MSEGRETQVRTLAYRQFESGTVFLEHDGPWLIVKRERRNDGTFDYHLEKMTPDEYVCWKVLHE